MKLESVSFKNYKAFDEKQEIKIKPITLLIGKNSSGKSSIAKLFTLLENSLSGEISEPLLLNNNGVELGSDFDNLFYGNIRSGAGFPLVFALKFDNNVTLEVGLFRKETDFGLYFHQWFYSSPELNIKLEYSTNGNYIDTITGKTYKCNFNGFNIISITEISAAGETIIENRYTLGKIDVDYIGPFRILPERYFYLTGQSQYLNTGVCGENAYFMLGNSKLTKDSKLHENVGTWYKEHFDGWELMVDEKTKKPLIQIVLSKDDTDVNIVDVGQGMNQALPLVVRANVEDRPNSIIVLEQPELHLHPAAHGDLIELFAESAIKNNQTYIIETHSENILLRLRRLAIENDFGFTNEDLIIYYIDKSENKGQKLVEYTIDEDGVLSDWPEGVFTEGLKEVLTIQNLLRQKENKEVK